ncbi:AraC-like DNA-binding protein [Aquamicrobium lusatiense]|jgi:AraC-like DNA-binding protein|uniref:AraC-like DNA-binding protein n=1 Tax=Aquamicrobium lusatiense TaxID=89772 RepID=A0A7W9S6N2_9HYPH|nr:AraC family transcriptional regulator [Aquamicrobium lusatiense]MBB6013988.1 AraC-like DNA-binding protein [Aquamicrobium lusatiense]
MDNRIPEQGMTLNDLVRLGAELALGVEPVDVGPRIMETPIYTGRLLALEVQPGLMLSASDVTYASNQNFAVEMEPALVCGIMLSGGPVTSMVEGYGRFVRYPQQVSLMGFNAPLRYSTPLRQGAHFTSAGFVLRPSFFERFADGVADDGLMALRELTEGGFRTGVISHSPLITEIARLCLDHPYTGQLERLFLESRALAFVIEAAQALKDERRLVAMLGRREYDRVMHAREILDADLVATPTTMELSRRVGINVTSLQANFKTVFGKTIFAHVREQRLMMAKVLLQEHRLSVSEAGRRVGFSRPSAFSAAYRKHFGHPPRAEFQPARSMHVI